MGTARAEVLVYVEDPGAANLVVGLAEALAALGLRMRLIAPGRLDDFLSARDTAHETVRASPEALLAETAPRVIVVGTSEDPDAFSFPLIAAGRARGVPTVGIVDCPANAERRFRGRAAEPLAHAPDRLAVPDDTTAGLYQALGFAADRIAVCGHPLYDRLRLARGQMEKRGREAIRGSAFPDAPAGKRIVLFLAELSDGLDPAEFRRTPGYALNGRGDSDRRTDIVLEEVLDALAPARDAVHFVLRLHPKNTEAEFARFQDEVDAVDAGGSPWEPAFAADLVIGLTTSLLFEAALLGRPALSVVPRELEKAWLPTISAGVIRCAATREGLRQILPAAAFAPDLLSGVPAEKVVRFGASERLAKFIAGIARHGG